MLRLEREMSPTVVYLEHQLVVLCWEAVRPLRWETSLEEVGP